MNLLNLPPFDAKIALHQGKQYIFDILRKKQVRLTSEEWVRQHMLHYLIHHLGYPSPLLKVEGAKAIKESPHTKRVDMLIFDKKGTPLMLIECKSGKTPLYPKALTQITYYNTLFQAPYLTITNGIQHFSYHIDPIKKKYTLLEEIPPFAQISQ